VQADAEDDRLKFQQIGYWYLGEIVNVFKRGNLLTSNMDPTTAYSNPILYGTGDGGLGVIVQLPSQVFKYVEALQKNIASVIKNCTRVDYNDYRNFQNTTRSSKHAGFVDGDLIESLVDMPRDKISKIIAGLPQPPSSELKGKRFNV
jgi:DNA damage-binding protein 1